MISVIFHPLQGADVNAEDVNQRTALHLAIQEHRLDTVRLLVEAGADLDKRTRAGDDALLLPASSGRSASSPTSWRPGTTRRSGSVTHMTSWGRPTFLRPLT